MSKRRSVDVEGFSHGMQPIPAASRVGPLVMTGGVHGIVPETGQFAQSIEEQARYMFHNLDRILTAAGASLEQVVKMTFYIKVPEARDAINAEWLKVFPDVASRPARHTLVNENLAPGLLLQCDATAFVSE